MAEVPAKNRRLFIDWNEPEDEPADWDPSEDGEWTATGSWSVRLEGFGEILRDTQYSSDDGFSTIGEAVTATEKWATDRGLDVKTFGVQMTATDQPLRGDG